MKYLNTILATLIVGCSIPLTSSAVVAGQDAILTVGTRGTYSTIQEAVDVSLGLLGNSRVEIRVAVAAARRR